MCCVLKRNVGQRCWCRGEKKLTRQFQFQSLINVQATFHGHIMRWGNMNRVHNFHMLLFYVILVHVKKFAVKSSVIHRNLGRPRSCLQKIKHQGRDCCANTTEKSRADLIASGAGFKCFYAFQMRQHLLKPCLRFSHSRFQDYKISR